MQIDSVSVLVPVWGVRPMPDFTKHILQLLLIYRMEVAQAAGDVIRSFTRWEIFKASSGGTALPT